MNALVRVMNGDVDVESMTPEEKYALAEILVPDKARDMLHRTLASLNDDDKETFQQIGKRLGVHEATAARWAKPPAEDRRRRRNEPEET